MSKFYPISIILLLGVLISCVTPLNYQNPRDLNRASAARSIENPPPALQKATYLNYEGGVIKFGSNDRLCLIALNGKITTDFASKMMAALNAVNKLNCSKKIVDLISPGGLVNEAMLIGEKIRADGYDTLISQGECNSACGLLFIAGNQRLLSARSDGGAGTLGLHQTSVGADGNKVCNADINAVISKRILSYLRRMLDTRASYSYHEVTMVTDCKKLETISNNNYLIKTGIASGFYKN